jgi:hypothetical protein
VFYVLALSLNYPHSMATLDRAYCRSEDFEKYRVFTVHITALVLGGILCSVRVPALQFEQTTATAEDAPKSVTAADAGT